MKKCYQFHLLSQNRDCKQNPTAVNGYLYHFDLQFIVADVSLLSIEMQRNSRKMMRKIVLLITLFCVLCVPRLAAQSYIRTASFLFSFPEGAELLQEDCGENSSMLQQMEQELSAVKTKIQAGNYHLLIIAHVSAFNYANLQVLNKASLHASYLRAYIISRLSIPEECMAFYIDRSGDYRDKVHVYLVRSPLPVYANKDIRFSEEETPEAIKKEIDRYGGVPYVNLYRNGELNGYRKEIYTINDPLFDRTEIDDYRLAIPVQQPKVVQPVTASKVTPKVTVSPQVEDIPLSVLDAPSVPHLGLSTNLLYWVALTPNLTFDWYFGNAFSFHLEGLYADWQTKGSNPKTWSVWQVSPELRYWFWGKDYRFTGHYLGVYGHLGDYDFMFNNAHGFVGDYMGGGFSYGYVFPLNRTLSMELGMRAGLVRTKYDSYYYDKPNYYKDTSHEKYYLGPTGIHCSLIYRF